MTDNMTQFSDAVRVSAYQRYGRSFIHSDSESLLSGSAYVDSVLGYSNPGELETTLGAAVNLLQGKTVMATIVGAFNAHPAKVNGDVTFVGFPAGESIQTILTEVISTKKILIEMVCLSLTQKGFVRNATRILELSQIDWAKEDSAPMSLDSVKGFELFIGEFRHLGEAILGVSDDGTLLASWRIAKNRCLLIEFLNGQLASFSLIAENRDAPDGASQLSGKSFSHEKLQETLKLQGVHKWLQK